MNRKTIIGLLGFVLVCGLGAGPIIYFIGFSQPPINTTQELDFIVGGTSDCLRFLNTSVPTVYIPINIAANEKWQLTINCTKMPGGSNGWTDVYIYEGYWDNGVENICKSEDLYSIISDIKSADFQIRADAPYIQTFEVTSQKSYTVFFVIPPGGPSTFHVSYRQL